MERHLEKRTRSKKEVKQKGERKGTIEALTYKRERKRRKDGGIDSKERGNETKDGEEREGNTMGGLSEKE